MTPPDAFVLEVWRAACRAEEIAAAVSAVTPLLARHLPLGLVLVRTVDLARCCLETLAAESCGGMPEPELARSETSAAVLSRLAVWASQGEAMLLDTEHELLRWPGLAPAGVGPAVLVAPLQQRGGSLGVLLLVASLGQRFERRHRGWLGALIEPLNLAFQHDRRLRELTALREAAEADRQSLLSRLERHDISESVIGVETGLRSVMQQVQQVAGSDVPVLLLGETGSGKEVVARAIHNRSPRSAGPFLRVNCGALPAELIDSELFGHERGSFTGAVGLRKGWFERADGGTLFLDECGELPAAVQVRLLRILQDGSFSRVGGERALHVDVRIIAATHRDLPAMVGGGQFREDLWYRLAVFPILLPPLRDRPEDIPALAAHFALRAARRLGAPPLTPSHGDLELLLAYPWPGNVRELAAVIERAAILGDGKRLELAQALGKEQLSVKKQPVGAEVRSAAGGSPLATLDQAMARHIEAALVRTRGRIEGPHGAAALLKINPHTLRARMRKLTVDWQRFREEPGMEGDAPRRSA